VKSEYIYRCPYCGHDNRRKDGLSVVHCDRCGMIFHPTPSLVVHLAPRGGRRVGI